MKNKEKRLAHRVS